MDTASTASSDVITPWFERSLPEWTYPTTAGAIGMPERQIYYAYVNILRKMKFGERKSSIDASFTAQETEYPVWTSPFASFAIGAEVGVFVDKKRAGKVLTLFRSLASWDVARVRLLAVGGDYAFFANNPTPPALNKFAEDADSYDGLRLALFPPKVAAMSEEERIGKEHYEVFEKSRKAIEKEYMEVEEELRAKLANLTRERELIRAEVAAFAPDRTKLKAAREYKLTTDEKMKASTKYQSDAQLQADYTEDGYMGLVQDKIARRLEADVYRIFRLKPNREDALAELAKRRPDRAALLSYVKTESSDSTPPRAKSGGRSTDDDFEV